MLATDAELEKLRFPLAASAKLDGVRAIVIGGTVYSRSLKPIPNKAVQEKFKHLHHFDGELIVGDPTSKTVYRDTVSVVMSHDKPADNVRFYAFDHIKYPQYGYEERRRLLVTQDQLKTTDVHLLPQHGLGNLDGLLSLEEDLLDEGYEGLILRSTTAPYKFGRSTVKEGYLLKLKRFADAEAEVVGFEERMHNGNEATTNELGRTKRSSHQAGKTGRGDLGALRVRWGGCEFNVGTGFTDEERAEVWANRSAYVGRLAKFKYFTVGVKDAPRHPVFLGWRDRSDM